ncbi:S41 family peptidase [bacterium]|nr:S41 family peptidase [bacterium]
MHKKHKILLFGLCATLLFSLYYKGLSPVFLGAQEKDENNIYKQLELFNTVINKVQKDYHTEVTSKELIYGALKGMLSSLDSHSQFMDPETYEEMRVDTEGEFGGLGIEITIKDNILTVVTPIDGTPAYEAGLEPEDKIIKIEGKSTKKLSLSEAVKKLRGKPGTTVAISILRPATNEFLEFTLTRDKIKIQSVKDAKILADSIGYIRLTQFQENTSDELETALNDLERQGMKGLILDLRNNPGGLLKEAFKVTDRFLGPDKLIVSTKGRIANQNKEYTSSNKASHPYLHVIVLVNRGSASGSEIVAGAIQDWNRGILIGTRTFGKGSVQSVFPLNDGSALRLTTAKYYTPSGRSIHEIGIEPDIVVPYKKLDSTEKEQKNELESRIEAFENDSDIEHDNTSDAADEKYPPLTDTQVERAVDLMKGIIIFNHAETGTLRQYPEPENESGE